MFEDEAEHRRVTLLPPLAPLAPVAGHVADQVVRSLLDSMMQPLWVLTSSVDIVFTNAAARQVSGTQPWVKTRLNALLAIGDLDGEELRATLNATDAAGGDILFVNLGCGRCTRRAVIRLSYVDRGSACGAFWPSAHAMLILELPAEGSSRERWLARFAAQARITDAELRILKRLASGATLLAVSKELGLSYATVRSHMQSIFGKTGCRRQAELLQLLEGREIRHH